MRDGRTEGSFARLDLLRQAVPAPHALCMILFATVQ